MAKGLASRLPIVALLLLAACSTTPYLVSQPGPVGTIEQSVGVPTLLRDAQPYVLDKQSQLFRGDIIRTDAHSLVEIRLANSSRITLSPNSEFHIENSASDGSTWQHRFNLSSGALEYTHGNIEERLQISTTMAVIEASNASLLTGYSAVYRRLDVVSLSDTEVIVRNQDGEITLMAPMEASAISPGAAPQAKTTWSAAKLKSTRTSYNRTDREKSP